MRAKPWEVVVSLAEVTVQKGSLSVWPQSQPNGSLSVWSFLLDENTPDRALSRHSRLNCRASGLLRPRCRRRCAHAQAPLARCSAHGAGRRCRASGLLRPRSCRRYACAQAPLAGCSAHRAEKGLQGERLAAPSKSQGPELRCALIIMQALRLCAGAARQVLSALGGEGMQGERVAAPQV